MIKCTFLLPLHDNSGKDFYDALIRSILRQVAAQFGGYTVAGECRGHYTMGDGTPAIDRTRPVTVCVKGQDGVRQLRRLVAEVGRELGQETMYLEVSTAVVEFVSSDDGDIALTEALTLELPDDGDPVEQANHADREERQASDRAIALFEQHYPDAGQQPTPIDWRPDNWGTPRSHP